LIVARHPNGTHSLFTARLLCAVPIWWRYTPIYWLCGPLCWLCAHLAIFVAGGRDNSPPYRQHKARRCLAVVERMGVSQHIGGQLRPGDGVRRQALQNRLGATAQLRGHRGLSSREALQQTDADRQLKQRNQPRVLAAIDDVGPKRFQPMPLGNEVHDRAVQLFQRVAQRRRDTGALQRSVDQANVDVQGSGRALRTAEQRGQCCVFACREPADVHALDDVVERRTFKALAQALSQ
jgi:hypothetical protein